MIRTFTQLWETLEPTGRTTSGYRRYSWTSADLQCRQWFIEQAKARGLDVGPDRNGNLWAWWGRRGPGAIVTGSHLDSVPDGGAFDGPLGVVSGLAAIDLLRERGVTPIRPLAVAVFVEEEGARFGLACLGSKLLTGSVDPGRARALTDDNGVTYADAMTAVGLDPAGIGPDEELLADIAAFIELHIEQGRALADLSAPPATPPPADTPTPTPADTRPPAGTLTPTPAGQLRNRHAKLDDLSGSKVLDRAIDTLRSDRCGGADSAIDTLKSDGSGSGLDLLPPNAIGLGECIWPHGRWRFDFTGRADHAGTARFADRRDPMLPFASTVLAARQIAAERGSLATFGKVIVEPGGVNGVPSSVHAWLDARAADEETLSETVNQCRYDSKRFSEAHDVSLSVKQESATTEVRFDEALRRRITRVLGAVPVLPTGAGHDAGVLAGRVPTAMLFVRNPTGVSHSPAEAAEMADCEAGVWALATVLEELACK